MSNEKTTTAKTETKAPEPHEVAKKFAGDPNAPSPMLLAQIACHVCGDGEKDIVTRWASAFKAINPELFLEAAARK
jgi:hypothetical protein